MLRHAWDRAGADKVRIGLAVKSASYILLQGVPGHIDLEDVRYSINEVDGVLSLHEVGRERSALHRPITS